MGWASPPQLPRTRTTPRYTRDDSASVVVTLSLSKGRLVSSHSHAQPPSRARDCMPAMTPRPARTGDVTHSLARRRTSRSWMRQVLSRHARLMWKPIWPSAMSGAGRFDCNSSKIFRPFNSKVTRPARDRRKNLFCAAAAAAGKVPQRRQASLGDERATGLANPPRPIPGTLARDRNTSPNGPGS